jgi:hypothetical protein
MISNPASRRRRREWLEKHRRNVQSQASNEGNQGSTELTTRPLKRKWPSNRPREVSEEEKRAKLARRLERDSRSRT